MKITKILPVIVILWVLTASFGLAQSSSGSDQKWVVQVNGSYVLPAFGNNHRIQKGYGGDISAGYRFDRTFSLFLGTGYYNFTMPFTPEATRISYFPLAGIGRVTFGKGRVHPFVFCGVGTVLNAFTQTDSLQNPPVKTTQTEINFYMAPGLGIMYVFTNKTAIFVQSRMDLDFTSSNVFGVPMGSPSIFIPIQLGISFYTH